jgi:hypothetical protein
MDTYAGAADIQSPLSNNQETQTYSQLIEVPLSGLKSCITPTSLSPEYHLSKHIAFLGSTADKLLENSENRTQQQHFNNNCAQPSVQE